MSTRVVAVTPSLSTAPGDVAVGRVEIHNDASNDAVYRIDVVGIETTAVDENAPARAVTVGVPAGTSVVAEVPISVPRSLGTGRHAAAFEITSDRPADRPALCPFTLSIASVARVDLEPQPSTIRARRRAKFQVDVTNNEPQAVAVTLDAEATDVDIRFGSDNFSLAPGQRAVAKAKLKGPRQWTGEPTQHNIVITARGRASSTTTTAAYIQRPLFAHKLRMAVAALTVIALWLGAIGGVAFWLANRSDDAGPTSADLVGVDTDGDGIADSFFDADGNPVTATDTNGDGIPDAFVDANGNPVTGTDTDGDGIPDTLVDSDGNQLEAVDTDGDGDADALSDGSAEQVIADGDDGPAVPSSTVLRGTVQAQGDSSDISITLAPVELGAQPSAQTAALGFAGGGAGKLWPARYGRVDASTGPIRQTEAVTPLQITPDTDGIWLFTDVAIRQTYELVFTKPGFDTQAFVITPPEDGSPIDLDVELVPATGFVSGRVTGPGGALGGVAIVVSDGTLTFETTSATDGDVGSWSLEGLSTPGVYTMTASLRGYGTETVQIDLGAGDERTGVNLAMRPGVGSVSGRVVGETGQPLAGATVTATNGETVLTTSTLTEGAIGSFNLPQLDVPLTYTVKVELDGYITQTRRVPLNGALGGVDFVMNRTTLRLSGQVDSSGGGGISSAGVILSTGDLQFRTSTAVAPDTGAFSVDDLPPGVYSITFEHFQHETVTEFVTLTAGVTPAPLNVTMQATDGPPDVGTGSLVVTVLDNDPLADPQGIVGATVTLTRPRTGDAPIIVRDAASSNVRIDDLPIGTYTLRATAPGFNGSIPQQVSIGLNEERREIRLQELGQANGTMIDSISGAVLDVYTIQVSRVFPTGDIPVGVFDSDSGSWQTDPGVLATGRYRVEVLSVPRGYVVRNDQLLDPLAGEPMEFIVPTVEEAAIEPITILPIEADPLPDISGRIFEPRGNGTDLPSFFPIDEPASSLSVAAECNGEPVGNIRLSDQAGDRGPDLLDEFLVPKGDLDRAIRPLGAADSTTVLPASCEITISAAGYEPLTFTIDDLVPSNGSTLTNRRVNTALVAPAPSLTGTVFWTDDADPEPVPAADRLTLGGVAVSSATNPIVGFLPTESSPTDLEPNPTFDRDPLTASSQANGTWTIDGQVFGVTEYVFVEPGFGDGTIRVEIDENGRTVTAGSNTLVADEAAGIAVELEPPLPGTISGRVSILTNTPGDVFTGNTVVTASPPTGPDVVPTTFSGAGEFSISGAAAGTWTVTFDPPPNHDFFTGGPSSVTERVGPFVPGAVFDGFDTTLVELASVDVQLLDSGTSDPIANGTLALTTSASGTIGATAATTTGPQQTITGLAVDGSDPVGTPVTFDAAVTVPGYVVDSARTSPFGTTIDIANLKIQALAGETETVTLYFDPQGSVKGKVLGKNSATGPFAPLPVADTVVTATKVNRDGTALVPQASPLPVTLDADGNFALVADPGFYLFAFANGEYEDIPLVIPTDPLDPFNPLIGVPPNGDLVYEVRNNFDNELTADVVVDRIKGEVTIEAVESLTSGTPVTGAVYDVLANCSDAATAGTPVPATSVDLYPGSYCLKVNKYSTFPTQIAFPAVAVLTILPAVDDVASTITVRAPLPNIAPSLTGTIRAVNENDDPVDIPDCSALFTGMGITSEFDGTLLVDVGGSDVTNLEDPDRTATITTGQTVAVPPVPTGECIYTFETMVSGTHIISVPQPTDLVWRVPSAPGPTDDPVPTFQETITGAIGPETGADIVFTVPSADVTVALSDSGSGAIFEDDTLTPLDAPTLTPPGGSPITGTLSGSTVTFSNVAYLDGDFALSVPTPLHGTVTDSKPLPFAATSGTRSYGTVTATPALTRFEGTVVQRDLGTAVSAFTGTITLQRTDAAGSSIVQTGGLIDPGDSSNTSFFRFDVTPGIYRMTVESDGYDTRIINGLDLTAAGRVRTPSDFPAFGGATVTIDRKAVITVNVTNLASLTSPQIFLVQGGSQISPDAGSTNVFTVTEGSYAVRIVAPPYPTTTYPAEFYPRGTVETESRTVPRRIDITVSLPADPSVTVAPSVTLEVLTSAGESSDPVLSQTKSVSTGGSSAFTFLSDSTSGAIPATGGLLVEARATGYRTQRLDAGSGIYFSQATTLQPVVVASGIVSGPTGAVLTGSTVTARTTDAVLSSQTPTATITESTTTPGTYRYDGLSLPARTDGNSVIWTIHFGTPTTGVVGIGTGSTTVTVTPTSTSTPDAPITVTAQPVSVDFRAKTGTGNADGLNLATVTLLDAGGNVLGSAITSGNGSNSGEATVSLASEYPLATAWRITHPGYIGQQANFTLPSSRSFDVGDRTLTARSDITGMFGTVETGTVYVCADGTTTICDSAPVASATVTNGAFDLGKTLVPGDYEIFATGTTTTGSGATATTTSYTGSATLSINDLNVASPSTLTITATVVTP